MLKISIISLFFLVFSSHAISGEIGIYEGNGTTIAVKWQTQQAVQLASGLSDKAISTLFDDDIPNIQVEDSGGVCRNRFLEFDFVDWKTPGDFKDGSLVFKKVGKNSKKVEVYSGGILIYEYAIKPDKGVKSFSYYEGGVRRYNFKLKTGRGFLSQCG